MARSSCTREYSGSNATAGSQGGSKHQGKRSKDLKGNGVRQAGAVATSSSANSIWQKESRLFPSAESGS